MDCFQFILVHGAISNQPIRINTVLLCHLKKWFVLLEVTLLIILIEFV